MLVMQRSSLDYPFDKIVLFEEESFDLRELVLVVEVFKGVIAWERLGLGDVLGARGLKSIQLCIAPLVAVVQVLHLYRVKLTNSPLASEACSRHHISSERFTAVQRSGIMSAYGAIQSPPIASGFCSRCHATIQHS